MNKKMSRYFLGIASDCLQGADERINKALQYVAQAKAGEPFGDLHLLDEIERTRNRNRKTLDRIAHILADSDLVSEE